MSPQAGFSVRAADYAVQQQLLHGVRTRVFVDEQQVPAALESDALDPLSHHVIAVDADDQVVGTGRLTPERRIGRMAVLRDWRSQGVGEALLAALVAEARQRGWGDVSLHAQLPARHFYARNGFLPEGALFEEAGITHVTMRQRLDGAMRVGTPDQAIAATASVVHRARRRLQLQLQGADDFWGEPVVLDALRRFATARHDKQVQVLALEANLLALPAATLALFQRLPSVFTLREPLDPADSSIVSAALSNERGDCYFRPMGGRIEGELSLDAQARAQVQEALFQRIWERSSPCNALRVLGV